MKCVFVLDQSLDPGVACNTVAILAMTIGMMNPSIVGPDIEDKDNVLHLGISTLPLPVLAGTHKDFSRLQTTLAQPEYANVTVADFTTLAQGCQTYREFIDKMANTAFADLRLLGLGLYGPRKAVTGLTGNLPLWGHRYSQSDKCINV